MSTGNPHSLIQLGTVVDTGRITRIQLGIDKNDLTRHTLITGMPGSGKTSALQSLILGAYEHGVKFCVVEPSKAELRSLKTVLGNEVLVFTVGVPRHHGSSFYMNMFEVPGRVRVQKHLDLLRSVFNSSFYMWDPLPQVLEQCLINTYLNRGFALDETAEINSKPFPTVDDLITEVERIPLLHSVESVQEIKGALITRLKSLTLGSKGDAFNSSKSIPPIEDLLANCSVIELRELSGEEKSLFTALLFTKIYEYLDAAGERRVLKNLIVLEEAHRIFPASDLTRGERTGHSRALAIETFGDILKEIRAFGVGVIVVDQSPTQISSIAIENTNLKIVFRTEALKDREAASNALGLTEAQTRFLGNLETRYCVCHFEGLHGPVLIRIPDVTRATVSNEDVKRMMKPFYDHYGIILDSTARGTTNSPSGAIHLVFQGCSCNGNCKNSTIVFSLLNNPTVWALLESAKAAKDDSSFTSEARTVLSGALSVKKLRGPEADEIAVCIFKQYVNRMRYAEGDRAKIIQNLLSKFNQKIVSTESI
jgi:DNA translocase FtsK/SpoIIIE-like protein